MPPSFARSRSTRRTATVTTSAPDASIASIIVSFESYLPVPTISRDRNSRPAMVSGKRSSEVSTAVPMSAASDEVNYLDDVAAVKRMGVKAVAISENRPVVLDHNESRIDSERVEQLAKRAVTRYLPRGSVHRQSDRLFRGRRLHHRLKYS